MKNQQYSCIIALILFSSCCFAISVRIDHQTEAHVMQWQQNIRLQSISGYYLVLSGRVSEEIGWQWALIATQDYINSNAARYKGGDKFVIQWLDPSSNQCRIKSQFGGVDSYLAANSFQNNLNSTIAFFGTQKLLKQKNIPWGYYNFGCAKEKDSKNREYVRFFLKQYRYQSFENYALAYLTASKPINTYGWQWPMTWNLVKMNTDKGLKNYEKWRIVV